MNPADVAPSDSAPSDVAPSDSAPFDFAPSDFAPSDFVKSFTEFWTAQGKAMLNAQEQAARAMTEGMRTIASAALPGRDGGPSSQAGELARANQAMMDLWSAANAMSGELARKLGKPALAGDNIVTSAFGRIADPRQWLAGTGEMDDVLGRMAEGPRLADLWEVERRYARVIQAWITARQRGLQHNAVVLQAWLEAARRFTAQLAERTGGTAGSNAPTPNDKPPDHKATLKLWTDVANRQLLETQRSEPFLNTQRDMIRASTELRMAQQELVEHFGKQYGFPTRTELDDVHRTVTELRRELRLMRRTMQTPAAAPPPVEKPVRAAAARRSDSRKKEPR